jgi:hypothetical protein
MKKDELISMWEKENDRLFRKEIMDKAMIEKYINEKTIKGSVNTRFNILFYGIIQVVNLILLSVNVAGYMNNTTVMRLLIPQILLTIGIMIFGLDLFYKFREINNYSESTQRLINLQLRFFRGPYEWWLVLASVSAIILMMNVNLCLDNDNGTYPIYHKGIFAGITLGAFLFVYGSLKLTTYRSLRTLKAYLSDLNKGALDHATKLEGLKKRFLWLYVIIFLLLTASLVFGIIKAF